MEKELHSDFKKANLNGIDAIVSDLSNYFDIKNQRIYQKGSYSKYLNQAPNSDANFSSTTSWKSATEVAAAAVQAACDNSSGNINLLIF